MAGYALYSTKSKKNRRTSYMAGYKYIRLVSGKSLGKNIERNGSTTTAISNNNLSILKSICEHASLAKGRDGRNVSLKGRLQRVKISSKFKIFLKFLTLKLFWSFFFRKKSFSKFIIFFFHFRIDNIFLSFYFLN